MGVQGAALGTIQALGAVEKLEALVPVPDGRSRTEAGLQTAHPCDFSVGQLFSKEDEVIGVPIFTLPKHPDKPVQSMRYPISCFPAKDTHISDHDPYAHITRTDPNLSEQARIDSVFVPRL